MTRIVGAGLLTRPVDLAAMGVRTPEAGCALAVLARGGGDGVVTGGDLPCGLRRNGWRAFWGLER